MKYFTSILGCLVFLGCHSESKKYKKTNIPLPSRMAIFTSGETIDTLAKPISISESFIARSIAFQLEKVTASHAAGRIERVYSFREKTYKADDVCAFVTNVTLTNPRKTIDFIGLYRENNFDFFTMTREFPDGSTSSTNTDITKLERVGKEHKITYVTSIDEIKMYYRISFKDTLNQLLWYKLESVR